MVGAGAGERLSAPELHLEALPVVVVEAGIPWHTLQALAAGVVGPVLEVGVSGPLPGAVDAVAGDRYATVDRVDEQGHGVPRVAAIHLSPLGTQRARVGTAAPEVHGHGAHARLVFDSRRVRGDV